MAKDEEWQAKEEEINQALLAQQSPEGLDDTILFDRGTFQQAIKDSKESPVSEKGKNAEERLTEGSSWMSIASIVSRLLGVLYIIPWMRWMGTSVVANEANALFNVGYRWYAIFIAVSISGVPSAIASQMASYHAKKQYKTAQRLFKSAFYLMAVSGIVCAIILYVGAPIFAKNAPARDPESVIRTIRSLVPALAVFPVLSIMRGYFQGHQFMKPSAVSQIVEQVARVVYMLAAVYWIRRVAHGSVESAVVQSTFAAFLGAIVAMITLGIYYIKNREQYAISGAVDASPNIRTKSLLKEIIMIAIPYVITGSIIEFTQLIDTNTFVPIMHRFTHLDELAIINEYSLFSANANKLVTVIVSLASSISITSIPVISDTFTREKSKHSDSKFRSFKMPKTGQLISHTLQLFCTVMLPAAMGMVIVARPVYQLIYSADIMGGTYLRISSIMIIFQGLFFILSAILQAMKFQKEAIIGVVLTVIAKLAFQVPMIALFSTAGAMHATSISFIIAIIYYITVLYERIHFPFGHLLKQCIPIFVAVAVLFVSGSLIYIATRMVFPISSPIAAILQICITAFVGGGCYVLALLKMKKLDLLVGEDRAKVWRHYLKMR